MNKRHRPIEHCRHVEGNCCLAGACGSGKVDRVPDRKISQGPLGQILHIGGNDKIFTGLRNDIVIAGRRHHPIF